MESYTHLSLTYAIIKSMNDIKINIEEIAKKGSRIYEEIKNRYEPAQNGRFLAINVDTEEVFEGITSGEAVEQARNKYPGQIFYVVKVGFSAVEILSRLTKLQHA